MNMVLKLMKKNTFVYLIISLLAISCNQESNTNDSSIEEEAQSPAEEIDSTKKLLFSTATVNNGLPVLIGESDSTVPTFNEDEWRQIEFISKDFVTEIDSEFVGIRNIYDNKSFKGGTYMSFTDVAVRTLIPKPINISYAKLLKTFKQNDKELQPIGMYQNEGTVANSFSFKLKGLTFYGIKESSGNVNTFCIFGAETPESIKTNLPLLSNFLKSENLYLVDWRAVNRYDEKTILTDLLRE